MKRKLACMFLPVWAAVAAFAFVACKDDPATEPTGNVHIAFDNVVGNADLKLDAGTYQNAAGESFTVSTLNYFVSNIRLTRADGSNFTVPQDSSYFLIREKDASSQNITLRNVPVGDYTGAEFIIGVDSLRSVSDISKRKGILDKDTGPVNEEAMYWDWNPGYIFLKIEGLSPAATSPNGKYYYHIGGFGGLTEKTINNLRTVRLSFGTTPAKVSEGTEPLIGISADVLKIFNGPVQLSITENTGVMFTPFSASIADNYSGMFSVKDVSYFYNNK